MKFMLKKKGVVRIPSKLAHRYCNAITNHLAFNYIKNWSWDVITLN